jgi:hypothetical protein
VSWANTLARNLNDELQSYEVAGIRFVATCLPK